MSHHYSGPDFGFPRGDERLDLTDLYAFPKPGDPRKSILIMNVHPSAFVNPPGPTTTEPFAPEGLYEFKIDTDSDAPDEARRVAATLLPEMMSYDPTRPASFPADGRTLTDDAGDAFLTILTNGKVTEDGVEAHIDLLAEFPYLGPPHNISVSSQATSPIAIELRKAPGRLGSS